MKTLKNINLASVRRVVLLNKDKAKKFVVDNLPNIFSCGAVASLCGAVYLTAVGTHKADDILAAEEKRLEDTLPAYDGTELTFARKAELVWKEFVPAGIATLASGIFIVASNRAGHEQYMAMLGAYELSKKAFDELSAAQVDVLGEEKAAEIEDRVYARRAEALPAVPSTAIPNADGSSNPTLFVEFLTGTAFYANIETIYHGFNFVNHERQRYSSISLNELLDDWGVETNQIAIGNQLVWQNDLDRGGMIEPRFKPGFYHGDEEMPCTVIGYNIEPECTTDYHARFDV